MESENSSTVAQVFQLVLKGFIYGIFPFVIFVVITSRTSIIGGIRSFVVLTGSMEPAVPVGSIVLTKSFVGYQPNDIIAFKSGNVTVTHRVIDFEIKNNQYFYKTQGDANAQPDSQLVTSDKILGKSFYIIPYVGRISIFMKTMPGFLLMIVMPALVFIIFEILNIRNEMTKEIERKMMQRMRVV